MAVARIESPKTVDHESKPLLEVMMMEALSWSLVISWKNKLASRREMGK